MTGGVLASHLCCTPDTAPCRLAPTTRPDTGGETSHNTDLRRAPSLRRPPHRTEGKERISGKRERGENKAGPLLQRRPSRLGPTWQTNSFLRSPFFVPSRLSLGESGRPSLPETCGRKDDAITSGGSPGGPAVQAGSSSSPQARDTGTTSSSLPWRLEPGSLHPVFFFSSSLVSRRLDRLRKASVESKCHQTASEGGRTDRRRHRLPLRRSAGFFSGFSVAFFSSFLLLLFCFLPLSSEVPA